MHTSTATIAVMPEVGDVDVQIDPKDIELTTARSSGAGGQNVNKVETGLLLVQFLYALRQAIFPSFIERNIKRLFSFHRSC